MGSLRDMRDLYITLIRVWLRRRAVAGGEVRKLASHWEGPYRIAKKLRNWTYSIVKEGSSATLTVHHNRLKPCRAAPTSLKTAPRPSAPTQASPVTDARKRPVVPHSVGGWDQPRCGQSASRTQDRRTVGDESGWNQEGAIEHTDRDPGRPGTHTDRDPGRPGTQTHRDPGRPGISTDRDPGRADPRTDGSPGRPDIEADREPLCEIRTRSGRICRAPPKLSDFVVG